MRKLIDKTIRPLSTVTNLTPGSSVANLPAGSLGCLPIGYYRGSPAFWDLDKAVVQPLVLTEEKYFLRKLDARLEAYDLATTAAYAIGAAVATARTIAITVPSTEVWFVHAIEVNTPKDGTAGFTANWRCSIWPDNAAVPSALGQAYYAAAQVGAANTAVALWALFGITPSAALTAPPTLMGTYHPGVLRLPGGTVLTLEIATNTDVTATAAVCTIGVYGYVGKTQGI